MAEYKDMTRYRELFDEEYKKIRELILQGETHLDNLAEGFTGADMVIRKMPAADVVEIVRCRDCIKRGKDECPFHINGTPADEVLLKQLDNDFCSYGERKEND